MGRFLLQLALPVLAWFGCEELLARSDGQPALVFLVVAIMALATLPLLMTVLRARR